jgi:hypothetical protein
MRLRVKLASKASGAAIRIDLPQQACLDDLHAAVAESVPNAPEQAVLSLNKRVGHR